MHPEKLAEVRSWLKKAASDLRGADIDLAASPPFIEDMLFHCQQAMERLIIASISHMLIAGSGSPCANLYHSKKNGFERLPLRKKRITGQNLPAFFRGLCNSKPESCSPSSRSKGQRYHCPALP